MSTSASFSDEASRPTRPAAPGSDAAPETRGEHHLLDAVLQQTLSAALGPATESPHSLDALRDLARRWGEQPFSKDPILVEMVRSILSPQWPETSNRRWSSDVVSRRVADVLFDDPISRDRLENLWTQLCQPQP